MLPLMIFVPTGQFLFIFRLCALCLGYEEWNYPSILSMVLVGLHSTEVAFAPLTQQPRVRISTLPKFFRWYISSVVLRLWARHSNPPKRSMAHGRAVPIRGQPFQFFCCHSNEQTLDTNTLLSNKLTAINFIRSFHNPIILWDLWLTVLLTSAYH